MPALRAFRHFGHDDRAAPLSDFVSCAFDLAVSADGKTPVVQQSGAVSPLADEPTRSIAVGGTATGIVDNSGDIDNFTVSLVAGQTYMVSLSGTGGTPLADPYLTVNRPNGAELGLDDEGGLGHDALITFTASTTGTYTIFAQGYPGEGSTGSYTIDVRQMGSDNSSPAVSTFMPIGTTVLNFIETSNDVDTYAVNLLAGHSYTFEVAGGADYDTDYNNVPAGELDTQLSLYDSSSNQVAFNEDIDFPSDISSGFTFSPTADGTYYLGVNAYPNQTGGYVVTAQEVDVSGLDPLDTIDWGTQIGSNSATVYFAPAGQSFDGVTSLGWSQYEIDRAMAAFQTWADVANLTFTITNNSAGATFKLVTTNSNDFLGYFNPPGTANAGVGVFAKNGDGWDTTGGLEEGGYGFITLVHEFGHGLGLAHPHDDGGTSTVMPGVTGPFDSYGVYDLNQGVYTTMSYNDGWQLNPSGTSPSLNYGYQGGPSALDIAVVQDKYGAASANTGNTVYYLPTANVAGTFYDVIWDTGGTDTLAFTGTVSAQIDLTAATLDYSATGGGVISYATGIFGGYTIAAGVVIENATGGSGADVLIGNSAANVIDGGAGNDTLEGRGGNDTFAFDSGDGQDIITDLASGDLVRITGYSAAQSIVQNGSNVLLTLSASDKITFQNTNVATVQAALRFPGSASTSPTEGDDTLTGTSGPDVLSALGGNDTILGLAGNDSLDGGTGNDTASYANDSAGVTVSLSVVGAQNTGGSGTDTLTNIENLTGSAFADTLTGDTNVNILTGGGGADNLDGRAGADTLIGGTGNDRYTIDNAGDVIVEAAGDAGDRLLTKVSYVLAAGAEIETLGTTNQAGTAAIDITGNEFGQGLFGNIGINTLNGGGGNDVIKGLAGADTLIGGTGGDKFYVETAGDVVVELAGQGDDFVLTKVSYALAAGAEIESLGTTNASGSAAIDLTGNELAQTLYGNNGANILDGGGGADALKGMAGADRLDGGTGNDTLTGGGGADVFDFNGAPGNDTIRDFVTGADKIDLSAYGITMAQVSSAASGANTVLSVDSNHNGSVDFTITLTGVGAPVASDFIF